MNILTKIFLLSISVFTVSCSSTHAPNCSLGDACVMSGTIYLGEEDTRFNAEGNKYTYYALQGEEGNCKLSVLSSAQYNFLKSRATYDSKNEEYVLEGLIRGPLLEREPLEDTWTLDGETVYGTQYLKIRDRFLSARICRGEDSVIYAEAVE